MYGSELIWSQEKLTAIRDLAERALGNSVCPCSNGLRCPILGDGHQAERVRPTRSSGDLRSVEQSA